MSHREPGIIRNFDPAARGYVIFYHQGLSNFCPGCGHSQWYVGRMTAECAFCSVALPIAPPAYRSDLQHAAFAA